MQEERNKIYAGNLEYSVGDEDLKRCFEEKGLQARTVNVIKDKYTGRSKGFGFVEVGSADEVRKAIELLDGQDLKGRKLRISQAKKQRERF